MRRGEGRLVLFVILLLLVGWLPAAGQTAGKKPLRLEAKASRSPSGLMAGAMSSHAPEVKRVRGIRSGM